MATHVIFHEVDDVEHWLQSPNTLEQSASSPPTDTPGRQSSDAAGPML
jgi:hypothetical protein